MLDGYSVCELGDRAVLVFEVGSGFDDDGINITTGLRLLSRFKSKLEDNEGFIGVHVLELVGRAGGDSSGRSKNRFEPGKEL